MHRQYCLSVGGWGDGVGGGGYGGSMGRVAYTIHTNPDRRSVFDLGW